MSFEDSRIFPFNVTNASHFINGTFFSSVVFDIPKFVVNLKDASAVYVSIENATFPSSWYVMDESNNTMNFTLSLSGGPPVNYSFTFAEIGTYDAYSLAQLFNVYLTNASINAFTFTYSLTNNQIGVTWTGYTTPQNNTIIFLPSSIYYLVGLNPTSSTILTDIVETSYFPNEVNLSGVVNYLVQCDQIPVQGYSLQTSGSVLGSIPQTAGTWGLTVWQNFNRTQFSISAGKRIEQLTINIRDQNGNLINFRNSPWNMTFRVTYIRTSIPALPTIHEKVDETNIVGKRLRSDKEKLPPDTWEEWLQTQKQKINHLSVSQQQP